MQSVPRRSSVLYLCFERGDERSFVMAEAFSEMGSLAQARVGGYNPYQFEMGFPEVPIGARRLPAPDWSTLTQQFNPTVHGSRYQAILTYAEPRPGFAFSSRGAPAPEPLASSGRWRVYRGGEAAAR